MKIGIITYWQSNDNYGQLLQCFALQQYLRLQGHEPYLIRYDMSNRNMHASNKWKKVYKILLVYPVIKYLLNRKKKRLQLALLSEISRKNAFRKFDEFRQQMIVQSSKLYSSLYELQSDAPKADIYITGSDQVWSQLLNIKENEVYFLNFGDSCTRRVSYAASFAMDEYPTNLHKILKENLERFQAVSVREKVGVYICSSVGVNAIQVVDPTLLLGCDVYRKIASNKKHSKYVYIYSLNVSTADEMYFNEIKQIANKRECDIVVTPASGCVPGIELFDGVIYDYASIPEWLANIDNAEFVVTTSFHGVVFCILLHTPFVYIPLKGNLAKMNNRALNLLDEVGLSNFIAFDNNVSNIMNQKILWEMVDEKVLKSKNKSILFLNQYCNENII